MSLITLKNRLAVMRYPYLFALSKMFLIMKHGQSGEHLLRRIHHILCTWMCEVVEMRVDVPWKSSNTLQNGKYFLLKHPSSQIMCLLCIKMYTFGHFLLSYCASWSMQISLFPSLPSHGFSAFHAGLHGGTGLHTWWTTTITQLSSN